MEEKKEIVTKKVNVPKRGFRWPKEKKEEFFRLLDTEGFWNVKPYIVQHELAVPDSTLSLWKKEYIRKNGIPKIDELGGEISVNFQTSLKELSKIAKIGNDLIRIKAITEFGNLAEKYTKFLENFGYKDKIADKHEIDGKIDNKIEIEILKPKFVDMDNKEEPKKLE